MNEMGSLGVIEKQNVFPFEIQRLYYLFDVPRGATRGSHAHKALNQLIIPISGSFDVELDNGFSKEKFFLNSAATALTVPPGYWRTLENFSSGASALVLASLTYDENDYIRNYEEFVKWAENN
jgi:dTDP-4-dehydrorhamnose 3,5-epimerase-like enzyme